MTAVHPKWGEAIARFGMAFSGVMLVALVVLAWVVYFPQWGLMNCPWHGRCEPFGMQDAEAHLRQLAAFFRHAEALDGRWTAKETAHLEEVREIYRWVFGSVVVWLVLLVATLRAAPRRRLKRARAAAIGVLGSVAALTLILPIFTWFWDEIFHLVLFDNELWMNTRADASWWLMPNEYFRNTSALMLGTVAVVAAFTWWAVARMLRRARLNPRET